MPLDRLVNEEIRDRVRPDRCLPLSDGVDVKFTFQLFRDIRIILMTPCRGKPNACRRPKRDQSVSSVSR